MILIRIVNLSNRMAWLAWAMIIVAVVQVALWAMDRDVPYQVVNYTATTNERESVTLEMQVRRDTTRNCELTMQRWLRDARGFRWYLPPLFFHASEVHELEHQYPGAVKLVLQLPGAIPSGTTSYRATMRYQCNPMHMVWPLIYEQEILFEVP